MIRWLNPAALGGLVLLAVPVLIHLLRTHRAERVLFPSLRFIVSSRTAAVRLRLPADWLLLLVRLAIVGAAIVAVAQPVLITAGRLRAWDGRMVRVVIVDTSAAMSVADSAGARPLDAAREAATAEQRSAHQVVRIDSATLSDGLMRAMTWLATAPPARQEIVLISSFTFGAFQERDAAATPAGVGLRLVRVGGRVDTRQLLGTPLFAAPGEPARVQQVQLSGPTTRVSVTHATATQSGLRALDAAATSDAVQRLWRAVAAAGAPAPAAAEPLVCQFGAQPQATGTAPFGPATPRWMLRTLARLQTDDALRQAAGSESGSALDPSDASVVVATDRNGQPLVRLATMGRELLMQVAAPADSFVAAAAVRALLMARSGDPSHPEQEILRTPPDMLAAWSRPPAPVDPEAWRQIDRSDARWAWLLALLLLVLEQRLRRSTPALPIEVRDAA